MAMLALLMAGTSWAVASWLSVWLVPPYLIVMALLLFPSAGRPQGDPFEAEAESSGSNRLQPASPGEDGDLGLDNPDSTPDGSASAEPSEGGLEPGTVSSPSRARRGKGRAKKAKPLPEPTEATWVQVAPGKFVRVEASEESASAGPHSPVGIPVEVPSTPQSADDEPIEDVYPAFEPIEGPEVDSVEGVESESSPGFEVDEPAGSPGISEESSAADGNAPQADGFFEETEARRPDLALEAVHDRAEAEPFGEESEDEGERSPGSDDLEPIESLALADVPPEDADGWGETAGETDPTETPVDETDLDAAGPFDAEPHELGASRDADPLPSRVLLQDPSKGPGWWPRRLAPRAGTRVGHPLQATGRGASPRRLARSLEPARRPIDPRRLTRRGAGRPRQIIRAFPPRSPPCGPSCQPRRVRYWSLIRRKSIFGKQ